MNATATSRVPREQQLARATSDYLAISRGRDNYASDASFELAEQKAWENLMVVTQLIADTDPSVGTLN